MVERYERIKNQRNPSIIGCDQNNEKQESRTDSGIISVRSNTANIQGTISMGCKLCISARNDGISPKVGVSPDTLSRPRIEGSQQERASIV